MTPNEIAASILGVWLVWVLSIYWVMGGLGDIVSLWTKLVRGKPTSSPPTPRNVILEHKMKTILDRLDIMAADVATLASKITALERDASAATRNQQHYASVLEEIKQSLFTIKEVHEVISASIKETVSMALQMDDHHEGLVGLVGLAIVRFAAINDNLTDIHNRFIAVGTAQRDFYQRNTGQQEGNHYHTSEIREIKEKLSTTSKMVEDMQHNGVPELNQRIRGQRDIIVEGFNEQIDGLLERVTHLENKLPHADKSSEDTTSDGDDDGKTADQQARINDQSTDDAPKTAHSSTQTPKESTSRKLMQPPHHQPPVQGEVYKRCREPRSIPKQDTTNTQAASQSNGFYNFVPGCSRSENGLEPLDPPNNKHASLLVPNLPTVHQLATTLNARDSS